MSRHLKLLVFAGVFIVLLVLFLVFGNKLAAPVETTTPTQSLANLVDVVQLIPLSQTDVQVIQIEGDVTLTATMTDVTIEEQITAEDGTVKMQTQEGKMWKGADFDVAQSALIGISRVGSSLKTKRLISDKPEDPSIFGLDNPYRTVTLVSTDGSRFSLEMGSLTPTEDDRYVRLKGSEAIYTVEEFAIEPMNVDPLVLRNTELYPKLGMTMNNVTTLTFFRGGEEVFSAASDASTKEWFVTYPISWGSDSEDLTPVLEALAGITFSGYEALLSDDLKQYGLDSPRYQFDYTLEGQKYVLKLGNKKPESPYFYALADGLDGVLLMPTSSMFFIDKPAADFMDPFVLLQDISETTKMVLNIDSRTDEMLLNVEKAADGALEITFNGLDLVAEEELKMAKRYYQGAIGMIFSKVDLQANPSGEPFLSVEYWLKDNSVQERMLVEYIPTPEGSGYYAMLNSQYTGLIVSSSEMESSLATLRDGYANLTAEIAKRPAK